MGFLLFVDYKDVVDANCDKSILRNPLHLIKKDFLVVLLDCGTLVCEKCRIISV